LLDDIGTEARTLVHSKDAGHAANDATDDTSNNCSNRTSRPFTISRTSLYATWDALSVRGNGKEYRSDNSDGSDKTADHDNSFDVGLVRAQVFNERYVPARVNRESVIGSLEWSRSDDFVTALVMDQAPSRAAGVIAYVTHAVYPSARPPTAPGRFRVLVAMMLAAKQEKKNDLRPNAGHTFLAPGRCRR
jgi:hypothetical protein